MDKFKKRELKELYENFKPDIEKRILDFQQIRNGSESEILKEFIFCTLTPQSKAKICWEAVERIFTHVKVQNPDIDSIRNYLKGVRFPNNKAKFLVENFRILQDKKISLKNFVLSKEDSKVKREWLIKTFKGYGIKEASHFLRNTGHLDVAILDRHILKNMLFYGIIENIPKSLTKQKYLELEEKFFEFSKLIDIPFAHLDLVLWAKETGEVFK